MNKSKIVVGMIVSGMLLAGCGNDVVSTQTVPSKVESENTEIKTPPVGVPMSMVPQTPPSLTDAQTAQLKLGSSAHKATSLTFDVTGGSFYFVPNEIHVKKGDKVKIIFNNAGGMHNFIIDEFKVKIDTIKTGENASAEFVADKTGTFEFYCGVGKHRAMGQKGNLIVE